MKKYADLFSRSVIVTGLLLTTACGNESEEVNGDTSVVIEERIAFPDSLREKSFASFRPESQSFTIDAGDDTLLVAKGGTSVFVAQNSFISSDGKPVTGPVEIKMIEVLSDGDVIRSGMQTVSNGQLLESEGMLFIDAKSQGKPLALGTGKTLSIEMPVLYSQPGIHIFSGAYDSTGNINWTVSGKLDNKMICLPLEFFDYDFWTSHSFEKHELNHHGTYSYSVPGDIHTEDSTTLANPQLENTFIATREFELRFRWIQSAQWAIGHHTSFDTNPAMKGTLIADSTILKIYLDNLDKELWYCDSLAYDYIKTWHDKPMVANWELFTEGAPGPDLLDAFLSFKDERRSKCIPFPDVNLDAPDARERLKAKNYSELESTEILNAYSVRKRLLAARKDEEGTFRMMQNSFEVAQLGWINCDRFLDDPNTQDLELVTKITNASEFNYVELSLILNWRKLALKAYMTDSGQYRFGFQPAKTVRLPVNEPATLIAIAYKDGVPHFATQEFYLELKGDYELTLQKSTKEAIDSVLTDLR